MILPTTFIFDVLLGGEMLTFMWHWCRPAASALAIHKKMHARWFSEKHELTEVHKDNFCHCLGQYLRTPTPVSLLTEATAMKSSIRPTFLFAWKKRHKLEKHDTVRVTRRFHAREGQ